jgi:hypothetical protein
MKSNNKFLIGAAISGAMLVISAMPVQAAGEAGECHGVNACKGQGDCGGKNKDGVKHSCAGQNACKGQGWLGMTKEQCDKKGGKFKAKK